MTRYGFGKPTISFEPTKDKTIVRGIYGENVTLQLQQPGPGSIPVCAWSYSPGPGQLSGMVRLKGQPTTGAGVGFANVSIACAETITNHDGFYALDLAAGNYWAVATWQDPKTSDSWKINEVVKIKFGGETVHDFILNPPPIDFRQVVIDVQGDAVEGTILAKGWTPIFSSGFIPLGPRGNPAIPSDAAGLTGTWKSGDMVFSEGRAVTVEVDANLSIKGFVTGLVTAHITHDGDSEHTETQTFAIAPGSSTPVIFNMSTAGWFPDVADIIVTISNEQGYGPS